MHRSYSQHVGIQVFRMFSPKSIIENLHQTVNRRSDASVLISILGQFLYAFHETGAPEQILLGNQHCPFLLYGTL